MIGMMINQGFVVFAAKFSSGDIVEVVNTGTSGLLVRDAPAGNVIGGKYDGSRGMVLAGPQSASLGGVIYTWWKVRWGDEVLEGWSAEGYPGGVDYLKYVYAPPSTKFSIGDGVEVYNTGTLGLVVRTDPPTLAYYGNVPDGTFGQIVDGPFYGVPEGKAGFYYFWKVNYGSITGWSAEDWLTKVVVVGEPVITSSLAIVQSPPYYVGDTITATFTITNKATVPFTFDVLTVGGRDPDDQVADFTWITSTTLSSGESYNYEGTLTLTKVGNYHFFCAYRKPDGGWNTAIPTESGVTNVLDITVSQPVPPPAIYIRADGSVDPPTAPIQHDGNIYTFTDNIYDSIVLQKNNIVIDGAGYILQGPGMDIFPSNGIDISGRSNVTIKNVEIMAFAQAIYSVGSSYNFISGNNIASNGAGICFWGSSYNTVSGNHIISAPMDRDTSGIYLWQSSNNIVSENTITNTVHGLSIVYSSDNFISGNVLTGNEWAFFVHGWHLNEFMHFIGVSNLVDGKPVYYLINQTNLIIDPATYPQVGYLALINCLNINVKDLTLTGNGQGILLASTDNSRIARNIIKNNGVGMALYWSSYNTISWNEITKKKALGEGIFLHESSNNLFTANVFDSPVQITDDSWDHQGVSPSINNWDSGYPNGGNYWSDYADVDLYSGPYQNETGRDGIWDHPYVIDENNQDNYPLVNLWTPTPTYVQGIDVSHYQGEINWPEVYGAGYRFAFVKCSEGVGWEDPHFTANMENGRNAGLLIGAYHFARPDLGNNAADEAMYFISVAGDYLTEGYVRPALNLEVGSSMGKEALSNWVHTWMATVQTETGIEPIIYVNSNYANNYLDASVANYDLWIAHWTYDPTASPNTGIWHTWDFWQYSDQGSVPGITGYVDMDLFNGEIQRLHNTFVIPPPLNQPPYTPTAVSQFRSDGVTVIPEGGTTPESTVVFKATVSDPNGDSVRLEIELRQIGEAFTGEPTPETISDFVSSGSQVTITRYGLVNADYHWRYRAKDIHGAVSDWTEFGTVGDTDFTVYVDTIPPTAVITSGPSGTIYFNDVTFIWTGLDDVTPPIRLVYSYYLEGYDSDWSGWTSETSKQYTDLPSRHYVFKVKAKDEAGNIGTPHERSFTVSLQKTISVMFAGMTVFYTRVGQVDGEDIYVVSKISAWKLGMVLGIYEFSITRGDTTLWRDRWVLPGITTKDYVFESFEVRASDRINVRTRGVTPSLRMFGVSPNVDTASTAFDPDAPIETSSIWDPLINWIGGKLFSPGELRVYDSQGRVTGLVNGEVKEEIPDSGYLNNTVMILFTSSSYHYEVAGTEDEFYGLVIASAENEEVTTFTATDIPTSPNAIHQYTINWTALSQGEEGITVKVDSDGDGMFEHTFTSDSELTQSEYVIATDNTPPTTTISIGESNYVSEITYVTPETPFTLEANDDAGSGIHSIAYRISNSTYDSGWLPYAQPFNLTALADGVYTIEFNSTDYADNIEATNTIQVTLFSWRYVFTDSYGRGTTIKINTIHKFFQFITPDKDYGIRKATYMWQYGRTIIIQHCDSELRLITVAVDTKLDFCFTMAWDKQTRKCYLLIDKAGIEK